MSKNKQQPKPSILPNESQATLKKLRQLYGHRTSCPDAFGRRPAMPSEIEKLVKTPRRINPPKPDQP